MWEAGHRTNLRSTNSWRSVIGFHRSLLTRPGQPPRTQSYSVERSGLVLLDSLKNGPCANLGAMFTAYLDVE